MLKKCLKYDIASGFGIWKIASVAMLILSVIGGFAMRNAYAPASSSSITLDIITILGMLLFFFGCFAYALCSFGLGVYRYYQNCFTDEGYLTFTLPVKRATILNSKLLNTIIYVAASALVLVISLHITYAIVPYNDTTELAHMYEQAGEYFTDAYRSCGAWIVVYSVETAIICIGLVLCAILFAFSVASRVPKMKKGLKASFTKGIVIYLLMIALFAIIAIIATVISDYYASVSVLGSMTEAEENISTFLMLIMFIAVFAILGIFLYRDNMKSVKSRLNLE